jgi:hypothetical protein
MWALSFRLRVVRSKRLPQTADLQRFAAAIDAREVVPVHTTQPGLYAELFAGVREHPNGQSWTA